MREVIRAVLRLLHSGRIPEVGMRRVLDASTLQSPHLLGDDGSRQERHRQRSRARTS